MIGLPKLTPTQIDRLRVVTNSGSRGCSANDSPGTTKILAQAGLVSITQGRAYANQSAVGWLIRHAGPSRAVGRQVLAPLFTRQDVMLMALEAGLTVAPADGDHLLNFALAAVAEARKRDSTNG